MLAAISPTHTHTRGIALMVRTVILSKSNRDGNKTGASDEEQIDNFNYANGRKVIANRLIVSLAVF